ncbi:MAG: hypothetical protein NC218_10890 [Acetobacter sp.]|nr:hypothetical protein [Acetobacter sp.]
MIFGYLDIGGRNVDAKIQHQQIIQYAIENNLEIKNFIQESNIKILYNNNFGTNCPTLLIANIVALGASLATIKESIASLASAGVTIISAKENLCFLPENANKIIDGIELVLNIRSSLSSVVTCKALAERKAAGIKLGRRVPNSKHIFDNKEEIIRQKLAQKITKTQLAKELGVSLGYLYVFLKAHPELKPDFQGDDNG